MKRSFVYLVLALTLSLLLCGCGNASDGNVTASPWPDVTEPVLPTPNATAKPTATPDINVGTDTPVGTSMPDMSAASPGPADMTR